jgi:hypothetical protein
MAFRCPTLFESFIATSNLWPRGRAWPVSDGSTPTNYWNWLISLGGALPTSWPTGFVQAGYAAAIAVVRNYIETRLCALRLEFWCQTKTETLDQWMIEYGLPDPCDPFPDLCTKVAAIGGTRCDYYALVAARAGWTIQCITLEENTCGDSVGCMEAGCGQVGPLMTVGAVLLIVVNLSESPAYQVPLEVEPFVGNFAVGSSLACGPDLTSLQCILERVVHAHLVIQYDPALSPAPVPVPMPTDPPFPGARVPLEVQIGWLPPAPMPIVASNLKPPSGPPPQNPPFIGARLSLEVQIGWRASGPAPTLPRPKPL